MTVLFGSEGVFSKLLAELGIHYYVIDNLVRQINIVQDLKALKSIASFLSEAGIPYMVTGGQAVLQYGIPRFTKDIDVLISLTAWELRKVLKYVEASFRVLHSDWEKFLQNMKVLHMEHLETGISVDFIFINSIIGFDRDAFEKANYITVEGMPINYIVPEDLIVRKIIRGKTLGVPS